MKNVMIMLMLGALATASQADLLVNFYQSEDWVSGNREILGRVDGVVAFTTNTLAPAAFTGPEFFGGAGGTKLLSSWSVMSSTPDYLHAAITAAPGDQVWALYMFHNQSATITQVLFDARTTGSGSNQKITGQIVVRKTDGSYYISQPRTNPQGFTTNLIGTAWYQYDPAVSLTGVGALVEGFQLNNVNAVGELIVASNTTASTTFGMGASTRRFQAWGEVIPEPATVGMLGLGALVTLLVRRLHRLRG